MGAAKDVEEEAPWNDSDERSNCPDLGRCMHVGWAGKLGWEE
jgi:hypothetical protein